MRTNMSTLNTTAHNAYGTIFLLKGSTIRSCSALFFSTISMA